MSAQRFRRVTRDGQLVGLALFLSPVWDADNQDDVRAAKVAVNAFLAGEDGP